jgi:signal transduction histidine kinase
MKLLSSLSNRIFLASAALTVVCMSVAVFFVNGQVKASADLELRRELLQTGEVVDEQHAALSDRFAVIARVVADLPILKAAVDTDDPPTVQPLASAYRTQVGADLFLVTNRAGRVLGSAAPSDAAPRVALPPSVAEALAGRECSVFLARPAGVLQVVSLPITAGAPPVDVLGTLTVGFLLDDARAGTLKTLTGSEIAFAADGRIVASTLSPDGQNALSASLGLAGVSSVFVGPDEFLALFRPLAPGSLARTSEASPVSDAAHGGSPNPATIILRSRTEHLRLLRPIQTVLGFTVLGFVLAAVGISYAIARTITRPLASITATMRDMAATGDLTRKISWPGGRWQDEDARLLAGTFNALTESVTRFQREALERDRLSALGRLSTVIAHEVRNPLMIIKASLRPIAKGPHVTPEVQEAVSDIDEEVGRLNRLVDDVLDFARPVRFDLAAADVNQICRNSAAASGAGHSGPPVRLLLDDALPPVVTDAERLRSVLVNLLVNAKHAVDGREGNATDDPLITVTSSPAPNGGVAIVVSDRGEGIDPADLPRVFEPYFTTRRTGTGLGLAISRNIIEGLGGTMAITSRRGVGTEVRLELPGRSAGPEEGLER